jgi:cold shock CspA family protein
MQFGTVTAFDPDQGLGLIAVDGGPDRIRVDRQAVDHAGLGQIAVGQTLGFEVAPDGARQKAVRLWATWSNR